MKKYMHTYIGVIENGGVPVEVVIGVETYKSLYIYIYLMSRDGVTLQLRSMKPCEETMDASRVTPKCLTFLAQDWPKRVIGGVIFLVLMREKIRVVSPLKYHHCAFQ